MPFGRDTCVVPSTIVLDRGSSLPTGRGDFGGWNLRMPPISKLLLPLFGSFTIEYFYAVSYAVITIAIRLRSDYDISCAPASNLTQAKNEHVSFSS